MRLIDAEQIGLTDMEIFMCDGSYKKALEMLIDKIAYAPTIEVPQRMRGRWVEHEWAEEEGGLLISEYECTCCHTWERDDSNFCPDCGADMRGE